MRVEEAWLMYCKTHGMDSMNRNTFSIFKAGWQAAMQRARTIAYPAEDWRPMQRDLA